MRFDAFVRRYNGYMKSLTNLRKIRLSVEELERSVSSLNELVHLKSGAASVTAPLRSAGKRVLLAESFHLNGRNFSSLYDFFERTGARITVGVHKDSLAFDLMKANGNYTDFEESLEEHLEAVDAVTTDMVGALKYRGVRLADVALDEYLAQCIWRTPELMLPDSGGREHAIEHAVRCDERTFRIFLGVARFWVNYWGDFQSIFSFDYAFAFSGSNIYARTLIDFIKNTGVRCFVLESFFTGRHYYLEERNSPIPNNSNLRFPNYYNRYIGVVPHEIDLIDEVFSANEISSDFGKNVKKTSDLVIPESFTGRRIFSIVCQVMNDYSLISGCGNVRDSVRAYIEMISEMLKSPDLCIVIKCHPWEEKKVPPEVTSTYQRIENWLQTRPEEERARVALVRHCSLSKLFSISEAAFTLCSQAAFEAAFNGLRTFTVGGAFFDSLGFTNPCETPAEAVSLAIRQPEKSQLGFREYVEFRRVLAALYRWHLVPEAKGAEALDMISRRVYAFSGKSAVKAHVNELGV